MVLETKAIMHERNDNVAKDFWIRTLPPLYFRYGVRFFQRVEGTDDQEKIYDGFVLYGVADDMYVQQVFASQLELGDTQYR